MKALFFSDCICAKSSRVPLRVVVAVILMCAMAGRGVAAGATFVRVADAPLVFTGQVAAADAEGALQALDNTLKQAGSELARVVRLHAYVGDDRGAGEVEAVVAKRFTANAP